MTSINPPVDLIDIGINLTHASFRDDRAAVVARARAAGVRRMILTGTSIANSRRALELAAELDLHATVGIHPHDAKSWNAETGAAMRRLAADARCVALGECGLDFDRDFSPRDVQARVFEAQLELAAELHKPVFLHERAAHAAFVEILARHLPRLPRAVVHCFTGTAAELEAYLALDCYIGITGWICDERRGQHLRQLVRTIPRERLLIETDAPFLIPRTLKPRPTRNEPAYLPAVLATIAEVRDESPTVLGAQTTANAERFFALA